MTLLCTIWQVESNTIRFALAASSPVSAQAIPALDSNNLPSITGVAALFAMPSTSASTVPVSLSETLSPSPHTSDVGILGSPASSAGNRLSHSPGSADPLWATLVNTAYSSNSLIL